MVVVMVMVVVATRTLDKHLLSSFHSDLQPAYDLGSKLICEVPEVWCTILGLSWAPDPQIFSLRLHHFFFLLWINYISDLQIISLELVESQEFSFSQNFVIVALVSPCVLG